MRYLFDNFYICKKNIDNMCEKGNVYLVYDINDELYVLIDDNSNNILIDKKELEEYFIVNMYDI